MSRIIRGAVEHCLETNNASEIPFLNLTFRLQKKDGTYIKVLRKSSAYEIDNKGRLLSNFSMLTDISFISNGNKVEWEIFTNNINADTFRQNVFKEFNDFFTSRELEIIKLLKQGCTTKLVSQKLHISPHTVATHRKHILKKSNCSSVSELLQFCDRNGIL